MSGNAGIQPPRSGEASTNNRLDSWKEIAAYIKRDVRTVQRWEKQGGLPVHRLQHDAQATIYAYRTEIDAWWHSRQHEQFEAGVASATIRGHRFSPHWWFLTAALLAAISITFLSVQLLSRRSRAASDTMPRLLTAPPLGNRVVSPAISP